MYTFEKEENYVIIKKNGIHFDSLPATYIVRRLSEAALMVRPASEALQAYSENHREFWIAEINGQDSIPSFQNINALSCLSGMMKIFVGESSESSNSASSNGNSCPLWSDPDLTRVNDTLELFLTFIQS